MMKPNAVLINAARGPVIDEAALVTHLQQNREFTAGLDVFENEPKMKPGLADCPNAVIVPHIASASMWTRSGMVSGSRVCVHLSNFHGRISLPHGSFIRTLFIVDLTSRMPMLHAHGS